MDYCKKIDAVLEKIGIRIYKNDDDENDSKMDTTTELESSSENDIKSNAD